MPDTPLQTLFDQRRQFLAFVERRVASPALAEDILQAAYLRALQHQDELHAQESVAGWFYRVLRNAVIDQYRRAATEDKALQQWHRELNDHPAPTPGTQHELCACILPVLASLKPAYQHILRAVDLGEQRLQDFAQANQLTPANAAVRAHRARAALRKQLIRTCGCCARHACLNCTCRRPRLSGPDRKAVNSNLKCSSPPAPTPASSSSAPPSPTRPASPPASSP